MVESLLNAVLALLRGRPAIDWHDYVQDFEGQAHVLVLKCHRCGRYSVSWG